MVRLATALLVAALALTTAGCSGDPEQGLIGKWQADSSPEAITFKAVKMKVDSPDATNQQALDAARAMAATALEIRADKSFDLFLGGHTWKGNWSFDKASSLVLLNVTELPAALTAADPNAGASKPTTWLAHLDSDGALGLFMGDRAAYDLVQQVNKGKRTGMIILTKQ